MCPKIATACFPFGDDVAGLAMTYEVVGFIISPFAMK
jgi:hypothetical protein